MTENKRHWENIYAERKPDEVSWFQAEPTQSLALIRQAGVNSDSAIIDVGGGASVLVDRLLELGLKNISVLDIAASALNYAKERLGPRSNQVHWIEADVTEFVAPQQYDLWHDRAVFHFLTEATDRVKYLALVRAGIRPGGAMIIACFAPDGPEKCSGLTVYRYDAELISEQFGKDFDLVSEVTELHRTPWDKEQKFRYFLFKRR